MKKRLIERYKDVRNYTEQIFKPLAIEDYVVQPIDIVSPPKWSLGHTTWFFETFLLGNFDKVYTVFNPRYAFLFNSYYNNLGERVTRQKRGNLTRPTVSEIYAYRKHVDEAMVSLMENIDNESIAELIELGCQHEEQHQELFWTDLKYTFGLNPQFAKYDGELPTDDQEENDDIAWHKVNEGIYEIGFEGSGFHFDNELGRHKVYLHEFEIANRLVTNGEFIEFINEGCYKDFNCWHDEGWKWVNDNKICTPLYWQKENNEWMTYTLKGIKPVDPNEVLKHISFYEAFAFAEWKGLRLPTEFEWEAASENLNWGKRWEWTNSAYLPYPGYNKADGAVGEYNGKFMISQMVLRGASVATSPGHSRKTYRNFFHPWERWQFTGIRLAR